MTDLQKIGKIAVVANIQRAGKDFAVADEEAEFDDIATVEAIRDALRDGGASAEILEAGPELPERLKADGIDFVFNIAEGKGGRDREAQVPALLSLLGIPYSGSDALVMSVTLDKQMCKRLAASYGVRTAPSCVISPGGEKDLPAMTYPVIVKPNAEGSGKGVTENCIAENEEELRSLLRDIFAKYPQDMLVETFLSGREFTVGVLGNGDSAEVFPPMEIVYRHPTQGDYKVYSYKIKKNYREHVDYVCPAALSREAEQEMVFFAGTVFTALGCRDLARIDFRMDQEGTLYFLEINPLPGLAPNYSDYPMAAEAAGYGYNELICRVARCAAERLLTGKEG